MIFDILSGIRSSNALCTPCFTSSECCWDADRSEPNASATAENLAGGDDLVEANASTTTENLAGDGAEAPSISVSGAPEASATAEIAGILQATHDPAGFGSTRIKMVKGLHPTTWLDSTRTVSSFDMVDIHCRCFNITILY